MVRKRKFCDFNTFDATDLIALVTIIGGFILIGCHIDTVVGAVVTSVAGFYFGGRWHKNRNT